MLHGNDFPDTGRFQILKRLGSGGMGVVYEALDRVRGEAVALKTLRWPDGATIYRFKKEFRTLADIAHANLVALYELFGERDQWYFTMELVPGVEFTEHVRPHGLDVTRLRPALAQVAEGLVAVHRAGKLHRDLKPSNVKVTPQGRVVILDFGISADALAMRNSGPPRTIEDGVWGTVAYMAPEQIDGHPAVASDWYALGCTLYEALTGRLPYAGPPLKILMDKSAADPAPPSAVAPDVPPDLAALCMDLLIRDPEARPDGAEVLRRLGVSRAAPLSGSPATRPVAQPLVGRERHLATLEEAFDATRAGHAMTVLVHGPSGIGKSTMIRWFLDRAAREKRAIVLSGRCYVRESMPYKGFDGVVDSLTRFLRALPEGERERLMADDLRAAMQLFPALGRVEAIARRAPPDEPSEAVQQRRRAFGALRALFRRIAATAPVVLHIDDLQWGDSDSVALLDFLLDPPDAPPLLLIASFPSEDVEGHPFLDRLLARAGTLHCREIRVDRLSDDETGELARRLLGSRFPADNPDLAGMVQESAGNPFLVEQLVQYVTMAPQTEQGERVRISLGDMLAARLAQLPSGAKDFLEVLAIAARPLDAGVARDVAGLSGDERPLVALLQAERWLRPTNSAERLELYHDRIRRSLAAGIDGALLPAVHLRLAHAMQAHQRDDPETLYEHYIGAGQFERARASAVQAGEKAALVLAFERAARFYRRALELAPAGASDAGWLLARLGEALANAGRVRDAADAYARAAALASPSDALELRRRAAEQLLIGGRIEEGLEMLGSVLTAAGLKLASTQRQALLWLLYRRCRLRLRGLGFASRDASAIPREQLTRIDVCRTVSEGLAHLDNIRAADFQTLHLLLSLDAGEPDRIARALALEAAFAALGGGRGRRRSERLLQVSGALAERIGSTHARGLWWVMKGTTAYFRGDFDGTRDAMARAERLLLEHGVGVAWELVTARLYHTLSLFYLGEVRELCSCAEVYLADAGERGNRFAGMMFRCGPTNVTWLVADDVPSARRALREALAEWPEQPFRAPHYMAMTAEARINLYAGEPGTAWERVSASWPGFKSAGLERIQSVRIAARHIRGGCAVAASRTVAGKRRALLGVAERDIADIEREGAEWGLPLAKLLRAAVYWGRDDPAAAQRLLREAVQGFERGHMGLFAAAARRRLGQLVGGDEGRTLVTQADAWLAAQSITNPDRMTAMLAPGFRDA